MKNITWLVSIWLFALINISLFWPGNLYFLNDDLLHIPLTDQGHFFQTNSVRPIHELLVRLDLQLWGKDPFGYHLTALILHLIVCLQVYNLCLIMQVQWLKVDRQQAMQASFLSLVLFLAYPQSSESMAWILGRTPVLSAVFLLVTLRLFFVENFKWYVFFTGAFFFALTLFTYEQSLLLPIALLLITYSEKKKATRLGMGMYVLISGVVDIAYVIVRKVITSEVVGAYEGGNLLGKNWGVLAANTIRIIFRLVLNPTNKAAFFSSAIILALVVAGVIILTRKVHPNKLAVAFFAGITLLLIVPVISLGLPINSFESGRYLYLPSIFVITGISIAIVSAFHQHRNLKKPFFFILIFLTGYWLGGKYNASRKYIAASSYASTVEEQVQTHFKNTSDTLFIDTLKVTVQGLPVFRLGFKTGVKWLNNHIDTNKIVVRNRLEEFD